MTQAMVDAMGGRFAWVPPEHDLTIEDIEIRLEHVHDDMRQMLDQFHEWEATFYPKHIPFTANILEEVVETCSMKKEDRLRKFLKTFGYREYRRNKFKYWLDETKFPRIVLQEKMRVDELPREVVLHIYVCAKMEKRSMVTKMLRQRYINKMTKASKSVARLG